MRKDKEIAFMLRREGKSYNEIHKELGVAKSTLCDWFRDIEWSRHAKANNIKKYAPITLERLKKLHAGRRILLDKKYNEYVVSAEEEYPLYRQNPLFIAGIMLYEGEGDHRNSHNIRLANVNFDVHKIFIKFMVEYMKVPRESLRCSILLYPDLSVEECRQKWSLELGIPLNQFHKPQIIQGKLKTRKLHFGVGSTILSSSFLKRKLLRWIEIAKSDLITNNLT